METKATNISTSLASDYTAICSINGSIRHMEPESFRSAWNLVRNIEPPFPLANMIWYPFYSPKMSVCLLRVLNSKLFTKDFLKSLNITDSDACVLCYTSQESIAHLFFACPFSAYLVFVQIEIRIEWINTGNIK